MFGIAAVIVFVLSYQFKAKRNIIICNALSRVLYVTQYFLLGAFEGAWLDITAFVISLMCLAQAKSKSQKSLPILIVSSNLLVAYIQPVKRCLRLPCRKRDNHSINNRRPDSAIQEK